MYIFVIQNGWTAFICAARYGKLTVLQVLVQQEVDINIQSNVSIQYNINMILNM